MAAAAQLSVGDTCLHSVRMMRPSASAAAPGVLMCLQVQHHLLWVWGDNSPNAPLESLSKEPAIVPECLQEDKIIYVSKWYADAC